MNLTDLWKDGELPEQDENHEWLSYYIKHKDGLIHSDSYWRGEWGIADRNSIDEVLAPVPTYEELQELKHFDGKNVCAENEVLRLKVNDLEQKNAELFRTIDGLIAKQNHLLDLQKEEDKEVESLRDLLKECKPLFFPYVKDMPLSRDKVLNLLTRINTAIGESEE